MANKQKKSQWALRVLLLIVSSGFAFFCAEVGARIWILMQFHKEVAKYHDSPYQVVPESDLEYRLRPNLSRTVEKGRTRWSYTTNSKGFRGPEIDDDAKPGVRRILFLGDSVTFGYGLDDSHTLPLQFEQQWNNRENAPFKLECVNRGIPGYNTIQEYWMLKEQIDLLHPELVILIYVANDAEPQATVPQRPKRLFRFVHSWFLEQAKTELNELFLAEKPFFKSRKYTTDGSDMLTGFSADSIKWRESKSALFNIAELCRKKNVKFMLAMVPDVSHSLTDEYPFTTIHGTVMDWTREFGIPSVDLLPTVLGEDFKALEVPDDGHPNAEAHRRFARALLPHVEAALREGEQRRRNDL